MCLHDFLVTLESRRHVAEMGVPPFLGVSHLIDSIPTPYILLVSMVRLDSNLVILKNAATLLWPSL